MNKSSPPLKRNWILAALMLTMFLAAMDIAVISTVIPQIVGDLGGFDKISWVFSIYLLTQTATIPIYGKLSDIYGRKLVLLTGIGIFLLGSAASAASWNINALIFFRGLQGLGAGSIIAIANTIAGDIYSIKERAKIEGWLSSIWGISAILGPVLGGGLAKYFNWRWIFLINIPIGIFAMVLLTVYLKEKITKQNQKIDYAGAIFIFGSLTLLITFLMNGGQNWPWLSPMSLGLLAAFIVLTTATIFIEQKAESPIIPGWVLTNNTFLGSNLAMVGMGIIMMGPETYLPTFMQSSLGLGIIVSGLVLAAMSIGWPTASALSGKLYLRIGFRNTELIGAVLIIIACVSFLFIPWPQPVYMIVIDQVIFGAGLGLLSTPNIVGIQNVVSWERRGVVTGVNQFGRYLGQAVGAAIFGAIFNGTYANEIKKSDFNVPQTTDNILNTLHSADLSGSAKHFIKLSLNTANHHIYIAMTVFGVVTLLTVYFLIPKKLETAED